MRWQRPSAGRSTTRRLPALVMALALLMSCAALALSAVPEQIARAALPLGPGVAGVEGLVNAPLVGGLAVSGNHLVNTADAGTPVQLRGVNRSGTEYACIQGWGIFDGPSDATSVQAIAGWGANVVRVPLNEDCWLGINGVATQYGGAAYQSAIEQYVALLHQNGLYAELTLMWTAPGTQQATSNPEVPDQDHAPAAWSSIATAFKSDPDVYFGLINEPHGVTWSCWLNGGSACSVGFTVAGAQELVNTIRATGAMNVVAYQCLDWSNTCDGWLSNHPTDPAGQLVAEAHVYGGNGCADTSCFDSQYAPITAQFPMVWGEVGETYDASECGSGNISQYLPWADAHGVGYQAWTWDTWGNCSALISSYSGTPANGYGTYVQQHLLALAGGGTPSPSPSVSPSPSPTSTPTNTPTVSPSPSPSPTNSPTPSPSPTATSTATPLPPPSGPLGLVQATTSATAARVSSIQQAFAQPVVGDHLLVALVGIAGGYPYAVSGVSDSLGDTWTQAATASDSDAADSDVWFAVTSAGGSDAVTASFVGSGWMETRLTVAEFNGSATLAGGSALASRGTSHDSGTIGGAVSGDLIVGLYVDGGYNTAVSVASGSGLAAFGSNDSPTANIQTDQVSGQSGTEVSFATAGSSLAVVAAAAFAGGSSEPPPTPTVSPSPTATATATSTSTPTPSPSPSPSPAPASFTDAPAMTVSEAFGGGAGEDVVLQVVVRDPQGFVVASASQAESPMPSSGVPVTVSVHFAAIGAGGTAEPVGVQLSVEAVVTAQSGGAVLFDDPHAQVLSVP